MPLGRCMEVASSEDESEVPELTSCTAVDLAVNPTSLVLNLLDKTNPH